MSYTTGGTMRTRWLALLAVTVMAVAGLAACDRGDDDSDSGGASGSCEFNPPDEEFPAVDQPGVTDDAIEVGGLVVETNNLLGRPFANAVDGVEAYFCEINEQGGVYGRELKVATVRDDRGSANLEQARALVEEDGVFAVLPVSTYLFTGAEYLQETGVPTFGWNIGPQWADKPFLFGERGSYLCFDCPNPAPAFIAQEIEAETAAVLAYSVPESSGCATGTERGLNHYEIDVAFSDTALPFNLTAQDLAPDVSRIRDADVDLVVTCMDLGGNVTAARALKDAGLTDVAVVSNQGYDPGVLDEFGETLNNFYFPISFWPFELADENEELQRFVDTMEARDQASGEIELVGWQSAQLFVEGLLRAGESFTRQSVADAVNQITDWTAYGVREQVDWTVQHAGLGENADSCNAFVKVEEGEFVPVFGEDGRPFVCFPYGDEESDLGPLSEPEYYSPLEQFQDSGASSPVAADSG